MLYQRAKVKIRMTQNRRVHALLRMMITIVNNSVCWKWVDRRKYV